MFLYIQDADKDKKDTLEETVQKLVNKAGSHMESCIIGEFHYLALLSKILKQIDKPQALLEVNC